MYVLKYIYNYRKAFGVNEMLKVLGKKTVFQQDTVLTNLNNLIKTCLGKGQN